MKRDHAIGTLVAMSATAASLLCLILLATLPAVAQEVQSNPQVIDEDYHDTSIPVREMTPMERLGGSQHLVIPLRRKPGLPVVSEEPDSVTQN